MTIVDKIKFIESYKQASNAATGSKYDANSNVTDKNIATMSWEVPKKDNIDLNRALMCRKLRALYDEDIADLYLEDLNNHIIYKHDETSLIAPYCASITLYPFLVDGLSKIGGTSGPPTHTGAFIGSFINLLFAVAAQFAGAVATPEFLTYLDYFLRKDYGEDYYLRLDNITSLGVDPRTLQDLIHGWFQQTVYSVNQPAAARGSQSIFWNVAYFDSGYFNSIFENFYFPDGTAPKWESTKMLQKMFIKWFNHERTRSILTFPVETMNLLTKEGTYVDIEMANFAAEMLAEGHSFFIYRSDSVDALASCCRLRNAIEDNVFSYTLGAGGIQTGSKGVITLNLNRIIQNWKVHDGGVTLIDYITPIIERVHKYLIAFNRIIWDYYDAGMLQIYNAGFISLDRQFLTIGINGFVEGAEFLGITIDPDNPLYQQYADDILGTISALNAKNRTTHCRFNTEFVPAESLGYKNAKWDAKEGYWVPREIYNSYFYVVEDEVDAVKKFRYHGQHFTGKCDGGSALHNNLNEHLSKPQYEQLLKVAAIEDCNYFTFNIPNTVCNDCGHITKHNLVKCPSCGSTNVDKLTRVIGYLKRVSNFSEPRQKEAGRRYYWTEERGGKTGCWKWGNAAPKRR